MWSSSIGKKRRRVEKPIFEEFRVSRSIFDIAESQFYRKADDRLIEVFGETCETPVGPAAGPHTQLAQNIVASWLVGGRFIELKTVQIMDRLEIEKPCIDAAWLRWHRKRGRPIACWLDADPDAQVVVLAEGRMVKAQTRVPRASARAGVDCRD